MSTISEKEVEEDYEQIYLVDENGFVQTQTGQYLMEADGSLVQLSTEQIEYLKSKNFLEEQK